MASPTQQLFKRIVLHNRLLPEEEVDALLTQTPKPEDAIQRLVRMQVIPDDTADQLLMLYQKKIAKLAGQDTAETSTKDGSQAAGTPALSKPMEGAAGAGSSRPSKKNGSTSAKKESAQATTIDVKDGGRELLHQLLAAAHEKKASDLHIKPEMSPVIRMAGRLRNLSFPVLSAETCEKMLFSVLTEEQRQRFTETNDLDFCYDAGEELGRFRTNYLREHRGMDGVFRVIANRVPQFDELNLPDTVEKFTEHRVGIVLVTGPKGCGKTTTLAAMIDLINTSRAEHIITIEDPIEFVHPCKMGHVNQRQVGPHTKSFSNALRSALREAPDVIMVGEMRDLETTSLAVTAAETGHLVLATLHTPDAIRTIGRVLDVFPPKEQPQVRAMVSESLRGVVSQLLLPSTDGESMEMAVEILVNTQAIGHLVREERVHQIRGVMQAGKKQGMVLMDESLARLGKEGRISKEDAIAYAEEKKFVERELAMSELADN